ncbi:hypothetical protein BHM03_00051549 [Ensete ventricosum]|uniref:Uncharacterized protein n=1 Tax=Ensete ventricosum TaxID=4639 RepID=A0A445MLQ2_ENSVE|nr:hypothetical protein BHM03_00051549 [Ensete ventricosum]
MSDRPKCPLSYWHERKSPEPCTSVDQYSRAKHLGHEPFPPFVEGVMIRPSLRTQARTSRAHSTDTEAQTAPTGQARRFSTNIFALEGGPDIARTPAVEQSQGASRRDLNYLTCPSYALGNLRARVVHLGRSQARATPWASYEPELCTSVTYKPELCTSAAHKPELQGISCRPFELNPRALSTQSCPTSPLETTAGELAHTGQNQPCPLNRHGGTDRAYWAGTKIFH